MAAPVIFEYDPATGQTLASAIPEDLLPLSLSDIAEAGPILGSGVANEVCDPLEPQRVPSAPSSMPNAPRVQPSVDTPVLNQAGKAKVRRAVKQAASLDDLAEIEKALDSGRISDSLAARLKLGPDDFISSRSESSAPLPLGAQVLTPGGLLKVRNFIERATDMEKLAEVDKALQAGDVYRLQVMLNLQPQDIRKPGEEQPEEEEYDPFTTAPEEEIQKPKKLKAKKSKKRNAEAQATPGLDSLQSAYDASSEEGVPGKKKRTASNKEQTLAWPMSWTWLLSRTQQHPEFRAPTIASGTRWAEETDKPEDVQQPLAVAIATSLVYVGDLASGYDSRHLARVAAVDEKGEILLDLHVKPRSKLLDCRTHITGIKEEALRESFGAVTFEEVQQKLLELLRPRTILVGHRLSSDLEALQLFHGPLVDVALLFAVDTRKKYQYHPLRYIGEQVLLIATKPEEVEFQPQDAVDSARLAMRLALHESTQSVPTPAFPPREGSGRELVVRHIPASWGKEAALRLSKVLGVGEVQVRWILNDLDPSDWRGEAVIFFSHSDQRDDVFKAVKGLTDVHVQWEDAPNAPPLGAFLSEQALVEAFSRFGMVVCARIPRRPTTQEPQSFAFVSYLDGEDAHRVSKKPSVEVPITDTWQLELKPRLAKYGNSSDKRVAVKAGLDDDVGFDWIHLIKR